jgi:hypothetical protein
VSRVGVKRRRRLAALAALSLAATLVVAARPADADVVVAGEDVFAFGDAGFHGSTGGISLNAPVVGMAATPSGQGYWLVTADGGVFTFGDAGFFGSAGGIRLNRPIVGMAAHPSGQGYWLVADDGGVFAYGDAAFHGSTGAFRLNRPIVGMAAHPSGQGYWLVASDGGIFAGLPTGEHFGNARFLGSTGGIRLNQPVVGMAATPSGDGYWMVAADGGIFTFGDAAYLGSTGGVPLAHRMVGMAATPSGDGYWMVAADGGVFTFGDAGFFGSIAALAFHQPVVALTPTPSGAGYWLAASHGCEVLGSTSGRSDLSPGDVMNLVDVRAAPNRCVDRVTFELVRDDGLPMDGNIAYQVEYRSPPFLDTAGSTVAVDGSAFLWVRIQGGSMFDQDFMPVYTGPRELRPGGPFVREVQLVEDFERELVWVIGLDRVRQFTLRELDGPDRLVIDVG